MIAAVIILRKPSVFWRCWLCDIIQTNPTVLFIISTSLVKCRMLDIMKFVTATFDMIILLEFFSVVLRLFYYRLSLK